MCLKPWFLPIAAFILYALTGAEVRANLTVLGYGPGTEQNYDRFLNSPSFIGSGYDWSGVGRSSSGQWGTMVSSHYFLSAAHSSPSGTLTFYGTNSAAFGAPKQTVNIVGGQAIAGTDLWLGQVDTAVNFANYAVSSSIDVVGQDVFMFGIGTGPTLETQMRLGRNTVEAYFQDFSDKNLSSVGDIFIYDYDTPTGGVGPDEAKVEGGDSGAPTFMIVDNKPVLLGFHWFQYTGGDFSDSSTGSGDTAVARYIDTVNGVMGNGQQLVVVAVPEPGSMCLLAAPLIGWAVRRRWNRRKFFSRNAA